MRPVLFSVIAVATLGSFGVAAARPAQQVPVPAAAVRYADLDLEMGRDARLMLARIRNAAAQVCRAMPGAEGTDIGAIELYDRCFRESVARAVSRLDAPLVTAAYESRSPARRVARLP